MWQTGTAGGGVTLLLREVGSAPGLRDVLDTARAISANGSWGLLGGASPAHGLFCDANSTCSGGERNGTARVWDAQRGRCTTLQRAGVGRGAVSTFAAVLWALLVAALVVTLAVRPEPLSRPALCGAHS